ncbi:MAG: histidine kinase [Solirubrobacteraceae bacterium]
MSVTPIRPDPAVGLLRTVAEATAGVTGEAHFRTLVARLAESFGAELAFVAETIEGDPGRARVLASGVRREFLPEGSTFAVAGTPCELAYERDVVHFRTGAIEAYPGDSLIAAQGLDSYLAVALPGADGRPVGHIGVLSSHPIDAGPDEQGALLVFASRAAAEIERRRHQAALSARQAALDASRARLLQAVDEERRRIGRDLHDGAQQRLVALGHMIALATRRLGDDVDPAATDLLAQAGEQATLAAAELRELVSGLHPAGLTEHGLGHALAALAARSPLPLQVAELPAERLPEPVEVTVYYLVSEALTNAMKHAGATAVDVTVGVGGRRVAVTVADDGAGGADPGGGSGLRGLGERVQALGGTLRVVSPAGGGTRLEASMPLAPGGEKRDLVLDFGYEGDGGAGERLIGLILDGSKTVSVSLAREIELEGGPPRIGQRIPVADHHGRRRATVEVTRVAVVPFAEIGGEVVAASAAGEPSAAAWRATQERFYEGCREDIALAVGEPGWRLTDTEPMVVIWFERVG